MALSCGSKYQFLLERRPWRDGTSFSCLDLHHLGRGVASSEHGDVDVLDHTHADLLDGLGGGVPHNKAASDLVSMVIQLSV